MDSNKQIKLGAVISYIALGINILVTLIYTPWMVNKIGRANYGLYTLAISIVGLFMIDFGLSSAVSRFVSKYRAENRTDKVNEFLGAVFKLYFFLDIIILLVLTVVYLFINSIYASLTADELKLFKVLYLIVAGFNLISFPMTPLSGILNAYEKFAQLKLCDLFNKIFTIILIVITLLFDFGVTAVVVANVTGSLATIILKVVIIKKTIPIDIRFHDTDKRIYKEVFSFSVWTTVISFAQRLTYNFAPSILAITAGSIAVALYSPASSIGSYYYSLAVAINGLFLPKISRMISENKEDNILSLMIRVGRYQTFVLGLVFVGFFCIGNEFMVLWMGSDFYESYYCTVLVMIPSLFEYSQQIANTTIVAKNKVKDQAIVVLSTSLFGCALSFLASHFWGAIGACGAICIVGLLNVAGLNYIHRKKLNIDIFKFYKECYGKMGIPIISVLIFGKVFASCISRINLPIFIIEGGIIVIVYIAVMWKFGLNESEKSMILNVCSSIKRKIIRD